MRGELLLQPRAGGAGLDPRRAGDRVDLEHAVERAQVDATAPRVPGAEPRVDPADHARARRRSGTTATSRSSRTSPARRAAPPRARRGDAVGRVRELAAQPAHDVEVGAPVRVRGVAATSVPRASGVSIRGGGRRTASRAGPAAPAPGRRSRGARPARRRSRGAPPGRAARPRSPSPSAAHDGRVWHGRHWLACTFPPPASSPAAPGTRSRWRAAGARTATSRPPARSEAADEAIAALADRGSPAHDGLAARLAALRGRRRPARARAPADALVAAPRARATPRASLAALCVTRDADGRWLAGRRAAWVASWAGRWALGAGGAVEVGEDPVETLGARARGGVVDRRPSGCRSRRWSRSRTGLAMLVGLAWLPGRRRGRPTPSTTRTPGGPPTPAPGPTRPTRRCAAWRRSWHERDPQPRRAAVHVLHAARRSTPLLLLARVPGAQDIERRPRLGRTASAGS